MPGLDVCWKLSVHWVKLCYLPQNLWEHNFLKLDIIYLDDMFWIFNGEIHFRRKTFSFYLLGRNIFNINAKSKVLHLQSPASTVDMNTCTCIQFIIIHFNEDLNIRVNMLISPSNESFEKQFISCLKQVTLTVSQNDGKWYHYKSL